MKVKEIKEFLRNLVERELDEEFEYQQSGGGEDKEYLAKLIKCKAWLIKGTSMPLIERTLIEEDILEYL